jgi:hypothetical protein
MNMSGNCTFFTPDPNGIFSTNIEPFVRISVTNLNLSYPISSLSDIAREVSGPTSFTDWNYFKQLSGPRAIGPNAFRILYSWTGDYQHALPYVNQSSLFPSAPPISTPFIITPPLIANSSSVPWSNRTATKDPRDLALLNAIYVIRNNKIYVVEYSSPVRSFYDTNVLQAVTKMISSLKLTTPKPNHNPLKPAYCNQPIFANSTACKPLTNKPLTNKPLTKI